MACWRDRVLELTKRAGGASSCFQNTAELDMKNGSGEDISSATFNLP